jgi:hypothetical protein
LVKIGPLWVRNSCVFWSRISLPTMSDGSRSIVNWMRENDEVDRLRDRRDQQRLGEPGTPCSSRWPEVSSAINTRSTTTS